MLSRWAPGFYTVVLVVKKSGVPAMASNELALALAPQITVSPTNATAGTVNLTLTCEPRIVTGQRVLLLFGDRQVEPDSITTPADLAQPTTLAFTITRRRRRQLCRAPARRRRRQHSGRLRGIAAGAGVRSAPTGDCGMSDMERWLAANDQYLATAVGWLRERLERMAAGEKPAAPATKEREVVQPAEPGRPGNVPCWIDCAGRIRRTAEVPRAACHPRGRSRGG